jgi:hypothetical protein
VQVLRFGVKEERLGESAFFLLVRVNCLCHILSSFEVTIGIYAKGDEESILEMKVQMQCVSERNSLGLGIEGLFSEESLRIVGVHMKRNFCVYLQL